METIDIMFIEATQRTHIFRIFPQSVRAQIFGLQRNHYNFKTRVKTMQQTKTFLIGWGKTTNPVLSLCIFLALCYNVITIILLLKILIDKGLWIKILFFHVCSLILFNFLRLFSFFVLYFCPRTVLRFQQVLS